MYVPLIDLLAQYVSIKAEIDHAMKRVISSGKLIGGEEVKTFEKRFAGAHQVDHCISVGNGSDALYIALKSLGVKEGDEVIVPAMSWVSTATMITQVGATPVFVDVEEGFFTISSETVDEAITPKTKAVIAVHLYGQMSDVQSLRELCDQHDLYLIEDAAQAHLASANRIMPGQLGDMATFSFYPTKNLGAYGDAGAVLTKNKDLADRVRKLAKYGLTNTYDIDQVGINSRLDTLQAAILNVKLNYLPQWTDRRIAIAQEYNKLLADIPAIEVPLVRDGTKHVYYTYVIRCECRGELMQYLAEHEIMTKVHYPKLLSELSLYREMDTHSLEIAKTIQSQILSLPVYPELSNDQIQFVCEKIHDFYNQR